MTKIDFGLVVPGRIMEEDLKIVNKSDHNVVVKVLCLCDNEEFLEHDEYVYSIRKAVNFEYNEKYFIMLAPKTEIDCKVALKVPNHYKRLKIAGHLDISVKNTPGSLNVPIQSYNHIPRVTCNKELFSVKHGFKLIRLAHKVNRRQEFKIPFKNTSHKPLTVECNFHKDPSNKLMCNNLKF